MPNPSAWAALGGATNPSFSRDGTRLFHLRGAGLPQVWELSLADGASRQLSRHDEKVAILRRFPKDDRLLWGIDAGGDERQQLWLRDGEEARSITFDRNVIHDFGAFSPEGDRIAYAANDRDLAGFDVLVMDLATGAKRRLLRGAGHRAVANWSPTGDRLIVLSDISSSDQVLQFVAVETGAATDHPRPGPTRYMAPRFTSDGAALHTITDHGGHDFLGLCRIDAASGTVTPVFAPDGRDVEAYAISPDNKLLATIENDRGYAILRVGAMGGGERAAIEGLPRGTVGDLAWSADSARLAFSAQAQTAAPSLWIWEAGTGKAQQVWRPDPAELGIDPASFRDFALVSWTTEDGTAIPGWFARPSAPPPAGGYKSVIWVHGGPAGQTRANFRPDMQMLLDQGYAVLMPNIRGSTGYGRAWMEADDLGNRGIAVADLVAARAWLARQDGIDAERIGIMGQSYGGWAVLAAITQHPDLWRAAVDYYGIADWYTLLRDTGPWRREHRAHEYGFPERDDEVLEAQSPIRRVGAVTAPLLVAHGDRDPRVPMNESEQFVDAMQRHQKRVRYERFTYAGHGFIRPDHRRRIFGAVAEHFSAYL